MSLGALGCAARSRDEVGLDRTPPLKRSRSFSDLAQCGGQRLEHSGIKGLSEVDDA
jgi:hypothetical protein